MKKLVGVGVVAVGIIAAIYFWPGNGGAELPLAGGAGGDGTVEIAGDGSTGDGGAEGNSTDESAEGELTGSTEGDTTAEDGGTDAGVEVDEDVRTIGGSYADTWEDGYVITFDIPEGTQSDSNATFSGTLKETGVPDETYTGTYDHPSLKLEFDNGFDFPCTVADDVDAIDCDTFFGLLTFTRQ